MMTTATRYVGLDIHKHHVMIAAVDDQQEIMLAPQEVSIPHFTSWAQTHLYPTDQVALEATTNAWVLHDNLKPLVESVAVANTLQLKLIGASASKTDKQDALILAKLLAANLLPDVWVPPPPVRELRRLTQHRSQLLQQRSALKNKLHAILHQHNLQLPDGDPFSATNQSWWTELSINPTEALQIRHFWLSLEHFSQLLTETETHIAQLSVNDHWNDAMTLLMQLPGIGLYTGMTILAAIGDIARFPTAPQLVGYAGLGARVRASGESYRTGKISKRGRRELRFALIASAWVAVRWSDYWRAQFHPLAQRIGKQKAIVAIARKLLMTIWHILTKREPDRHGDPEAAARAFMTWASHHHLARSQGVHRLDFVRERLAHIGILDQITSFQANGRAHFLKTDP